ncbi:MAG TPA: hypothetical protein VNK26_08250 [Pyrinomonadaceae bacterium]|nr:hypothetical protein [Pyrinomonadaceae bacterium]
MLSHSVKSFLLKRAGSFVRFCVITALVIVFGVNPACSYKRADVRQMLPEDALIYLETQSLGKFISAVARPAGSDKKVEAYSQLNDVSFAVAIMGFEGAELGENEQNSFKIRPVFAAAAETGLWNYQLKDLVENNVGQFLDDLVGGDVELETFQKESGQFYDWKAPNGRHIFAYVEGSVVLFANDKTAIEKTIEVYKGRAASIANSLNMEGDSLAAGQVMPDGIAGLASIFSINFAISAGETEEARTAITQILPEIIRKSVTGISWRAQALDHSIQDEFSFQLTHDLAAALSETLQPAEKFPDSGCFDSSKIPVKLNSATVYRFRDPRIAYRSLLLAAEQQTDAATGKILVLFAQTVFEDLGIKDAEKFLESVNAPIIFARLEEDDPPIAITAIKDQQKFLSSLSTKTRAIAPAGKSGAETIDEGKSGSVKNRANIQESQEAEEEYAFAVNNGCLVIGEKAELGKLTDSNWFNVSANTNKADNIQKGATDPSKYDKSGQGMSPESENSQNKAEKAESSGENTINAGSEIADFIKKSKASIISFAPESSSSPKLLELLSEEESSEGAWPKDKLKANGFTVTETFVTKQGIERKIRSRFGFSGYLLSLFSEE